MKKPHMTYAQFLRKLAKLKGNGWKLDNFGILRCKKGKCPIIAIAKEDSSRNSKYGDVAYELGIPAPLATRIARAADAETFGKTRKDLLRVLKLKERDGI